MWYLDKLDPDNDSTYNGQQTVNSPITTGQIYRAHVVWVFFSRLVLWLLMTVMIVHMRMEKCESSKMIVDYMYARHLVP